jgi:subtilase family serine protease
MMQRATHLLSLAALSLVAALPAVADAQPMPGASGAYHRAVCPGPSALGTARCHSQVVTNAKGQPLVTSAPAGYGPADLQSAYNLTSAASANGGARTVAIVDAYDDPNAEADLGVYRAQYGLPSCTTANNCFLKADQNGGTTSYPSANGGWAQEISLDLDMVSAICPNCKILLVEAKSNLFSDLSAAVDQAAVMGATQISNSYGGGEYSGEVNDETHYKHDGIDVTVSSGDNGYGVEFPAASQYVSAVGGTTLKRDSTTGGWSETAWSGAGSGCSAYITKPSWQTDAGCASRTVADLSADADPNTGVAVYDSYAYQGVSGWLVFGGTSVAAPVIASVDALAGGRSPGTDYGSFPYMNLSFFYDIVGGSNGSCSSAYPYLCNAVTGFDGPTGIGTPQGVAPPTSSPPANTALPTISGTTTEGQTLAANPGSWSGYPSPTYSYQWQHCSTTGCVGVDGATAQTYTLQSADVGKTIDVVVTATSSSGSSNATSAQTTTPIAAAAADFSLSADPPNASMARNGSTRYTVTIKALNGFTGRVTLSISGLGSGVTPTWSANPATILTSTTSTSSVLTLTGSKAQLGTRTLTITGKDGTNTHSTTVVLVVTQH